jgi:hypothetical protein
MARKRQPRVRPSTDRPKGFLGDIMQIRSPQELVEDLGTPHRARAALQRLMQLASTVTPVVRKGLTHPDAGVRAGCLEFFDHFVTPDVYEDLVVCLDDPDGRVRRAARHALSCQRCKAGGWNPPPEAAELSALSWEIEQARGTGGR